MRRKLLRPADSDIGLGERIRPMREHDLQRLEKGGWIADFAREALLP
jgi:hypothetical protein